MPPATAAPDPRFARYVERAGARYTPGGDQKHALGVCPIHRTKNSLSLRLLPDGRIVPVCQARGADRLCTHRELVAALGWDARELAPPVAADANPNGERPPAVEPYPYRWFSQIEARPVPWLWEGRIALGMLSALLGDPGVGKSFILCALAAILSRGDRVFGIGDGTPQRVLMFSGEDSPEYSTRGRLDRLGADVDRIAVMDDREVWPAFDEEGLARIDAMLTEIRPILCTVDPLFDYIGARLETGQDNQVREILNGLKGLAERHGCALVYLIHLNKSQTQQALYRGMGSIAFVAKARSVLLAGADPQDKTRHALTQLKTNLGRKAEPIGYRISREQGFQWTGETDLTTERLLSVLPAEDATMTTLLDQTTAALKEILAGGAQPGKRVLAELRGAHFSERTIERARQRLGVVTRRVESADGESHYWTWRLPDERDAAMSATPCSPGVSTKSAMSANSAISAMSKERVADMAGGVDSTAVAGSPGGQVRHGHVRHESFRHGGDGEHGGDGADSCSEQAGSLGGHGNDESERAPTLESDDEDEDTL